MHNILSALVFTVPMASNRVLLQSIFILCFNAFLRLGEVVTKNVSDKEYFRFKMLLLIGDKGDPLTVEIV